MPRKPGEKWLKKRHERKAEERKAMHRQYSRDRKDKEFMSLYSSARWKVLRKYKLQLNPLCEMCAEQGQVVPAQVVHHKVEAKDRPDLFYDLDNLQSLCDACHNQLHKKGK